MLFQKVPMIPEIHLIVITHVILLNKKARVNVVEREQPTMLSVNTDILRNKGEWQCFIVHTSKT